MQPPEPPARNSCLDRVRADPGIEKLASGDHSVLPASQSDDPLVDPRRGYVDIGTPTSDD
jgi:hypothetical protein